VARTRKWNSAYRILVGKHEYGGPRCRWEDNITDFMEIVWFGMDQINLLKPSGNFTYDQV
jgi:hypothetical protein